MTDEMIEAVARAIAKMEPSGWWKDYAPEAKAAIEAARPFIKEECAKVCDAIANDTIEADAAFRCAAAIRAS